MQESAAHGVQRASNLTVMIQRDAELIAETVTLNTRSAVWAVLEAAGTVYQILVGASNRIAHTRRSTATFSNTFIFLPPSTNHQLGYGGR